MAHRIVEVVIGRLVTDAGFRARFLKDPHAALANLTEAGLRLNPVETHALLSTDPALWPEVADAIDPRLQKSVLIDEPGL